MTLNEAVKILRYHTFTEVGAFTRLRLGEDPGAESVRAILAVLKWIRSEYPFERELPRSLVAPCSIIVHFSEECELNLKDSNAPQRAIDDVSLLALEAYLALSGSE